MEETKHELIGTPVPLAFPVAPDNGDEEPDTKGVSLQIPLDDFEALEGARILTRTRDRSTFIREAINYYVNEINKRGSKPGTTAGLTRGEQILNLFKVLGLEGAHWNELRAKLEDANALASDSYWGLVMSRLAAILE